MGVRDTTGDEAGVWFAAVIAGLVENGRISVLLLLVVSLKVLLERIVEIMPVYLCPHLPIRRGEGLIAALIIIEGLNLWN